MDKEAETEEELSKISKNLMNLKTLFRGTEHKHWMLDLLGSS